MKQIQRLSALLLTLVILVGLFPAMGTTVDAAEASDYTGQPSADVVQVVIDYGKPVNILLSEVKASIHTNGNGTAGSFVGLVGTGSNSELSSSAPSMTCNAAGKTLATTYGTAKWVDSTILSYTPNDMLSDVDYFYAVYALSNSTAGTHIKVEIQIIPATMMYYEAEDLDSLETYDTTTGQSGTQSWGTAPEGDSANDSQDYQQIAENLSKMTIDRKNISPQAFFVDFDGNGNTNRYSKDPIYWKSGTTTANNFDDKAYWAGRGTDNVYTAAGIYDLTLTAGNSFHYLQTTTKDGSGTTVPLTLKPGFNHYVQVRFRIENCEAYNSGTPEFRMYFSDNATSNISETSGNYLTKTLGDYTQRLFNGEYITLTLSLSGLNYYKNASYIDTLRFSLHNVIAKSGLTGKMIVDYIYVGPISGLVMPAIASSENKFLYFDFNRSDPGARYYSTEYGSKNYNNPGNWSTDKSSDSDLDVELDDNSMLINGGTAYTSSNDYWYRYIHTGSTNDARPLSYSSKTSDVCRITIKASGGNLMSATPSGVEVRIRIEYYLSNGNHIYGDWHDVKESKFENGSYNTYTFDFHDSDLTGTSYTITAIRPCIGYYKGGKIWISDIYIGPESYVSERYPTADTSFFVDFTNGNNECYRYHNSTYTYYHHDKVGNWSHRGDSYFTKSVTGGTMVLKDVMAEADEVESYHHNLYIRTTKISLATNTNHYFQMRLKISGGSQDSNAQPQVQVDYKLKDDSTTYYTAATKFTYSQVKDKGYFTVTVKMPYTSGKTLVQLTPIIGGTQGATVTIDYIYVGPASYYSVSDTNKEFTNTSLAATNSLYFDFTNTSGDKSRYTTTIAYNSNDIYGNKNYDTNVWTIGGNASSYSVDTTKKIASIPLTTANFDGPSFKAATLNYHPQEADLLRIRFRLNGCSVSSGGNPRVEAIFAGYLDSSSKSLSSSLPFADTNQFQTLTIPLNSELLKFSIVKSLELKFHDIQAGTLEIDYIYVGDGTVAATPTYGYDGAYQNDTLLSDGDSLFVEGKGVRPDPKQAELNAGTYTYPEKYTEAIFSFTGTGVDIISRTGPDQGAIRVSLYKALPMTQENLVKYYTVNNKGDLKLYQIPVASFHGLEHSTYHVKIAVNAGVNSSYEFLSRGDDFYLDAIRVYNPIDVTGTTLSKNQQVAKDAYRADMEANSYVKEIRDTLLSVDNFNAALLENGNTSGAVFVDSSIKYVVSTEPPESGNTNPTVNVDEVDTGHRVATVADYKGIGPKNEVYLSPGQAIAFKLVKDSTAKIVSIDVGAKTVLGDDAVLSAGFVGSAPTSSSLSTYTKRTWSVNSASAQYFALDESKLAVGTDAYLIIYNSHTGTDKNKNILSVTDLKVCYEQKPTRTDLPQDGTSAVTDFAPGAKRDLETGVDPYHFVVDTRTVEAVETFLNCPVETPVHDTQEITPDIHIYHSLNLASDISVNYMVPVADLEYYDTFSMEIRIPLYSGDELMGYRVATPEAVKKNGYWYFTLNDLTAVYMSDTAEATLRMTKDGVSSYSHTDFYSISDYAYAQLAKDNVADSLKTLCADLLVYGAKAQLYKGYRTNALADSALTEEQRAYCSDMDAVVFGNTNVLGTEPEAPTVTWVGKALELNSKVAVLYRVDLSGYEGEAANLTMKVEYTDHLGETKTLTLTDPTPYEQKANCYTFTLDTLLASELRTVLTAQVYDGEIPVSTTLTYSPDTYGNNKPGDLGILCRALFAYSDSAKAYFETK